MRFQLKKLAHLCSQGLGRCLLNFSFDVTGGTRYANCFICNESGHLSKNCPKNTHGIYPKVHSLYNKTNEDAPHPSLMML